MHLASCIGTLFSFRYQSGRWMFQETKICSRLTAGACLAIAIGGDGCLTTASRRFKVSHCGRPGTFPRQLAMPPLPRYRPSPLPGRRRAACSPTARHRPQPRRASPTAAVRSQSDQHRLTRRRTKCPAWGRSTRHAGVHAHAPTHLSANPGRMRTTLPPAARSSAPAPPRLGRVCPCRPIGNSRRARLIQYDYNSS